MKKFPLDLLILLLCFLFQRYPLILLRDFSAWFKDDSKFGLDTLLGENGARISGGQRQRIGIARAIYNNSEILILDESTNALDSKNEKKIIEEIFNNALNKTIIIVSHNKENFKFCDEVYEIKNKELNKLTSI